MEEDLIRRTRHEEDLEMLCPDHQSYDMGEGLTLIRYVTGRAPYQVFISAFDEILTNYDLAGNAEPAAK